MNKDEIKENLTQEEVFDLLLFFGGEPKIIDDNTIVSATICHNKAGEGSHKLYYYTNSHLFHCYTACGDTSFDIFELVKKIKSRENVDYSLPQAIQYVAYYFGLSADFEEETSSRLEDWNYFKKWNTQEKEYNSYNELKEYSDTILKHLPFAHVLDWEKEGISYQELEKANIRYNPADNAIIIPHYDINNKLVGIRERTLVKDDEIYGKYKPATLQYKMYNHPLAFNLYNINNSKENIKEIKTAFIFEGEKSALKYATLFDADISVACCGSSISLYQIQLLLSLGVQNIIIAFDKQFEEIGNEEFKRWTKKLESIYHKYNKYVHIEFMFDKWNLLGYKDSPIDKGKDIFLELYERRFSLEN